jgi:hypothetical protein
MQELKKFGAVCVSTNVMEYEFYEDMKIQYRDDVYGLPNKGS